MRRLNAVLEECERHGVHLVAQAGNSLEVRGSLPPELRGELKRHKPNILTDLKTGLCHHELEPEECKVCTGYARRLIESQARA